MKKVLFILMLVATTFMSCKKEAQVTVPQPSKTFILIEAVDADGHITSSNISSI